MKHATATGVLVPSPTAFHRSVPPPSTWITSTLTLTNAAALPRSATNTSLNNSSSLVTNLFTPPATRSNSTSTTLTKNLSGLSNLDSNVDLTSTRNFGGPQYFNYTDQVDPTYYTGTPSDPLGGGMAGAVRLTHSTSTRSRSRTRPPTTLASGRSQPSRTPNTLRLVVTKP